MALPGPYSNKSNHFSFIGFVVRANALGSSRHLCAMLREFFVVFHVVADSCSKFWWLMVAENCCFMLFPCGTTTKSCIFGIVPDLFLNCMSLNTIQHQFCLKSLIHAVALVVFTLASSVSKRNSVEPRRHPCELSHPLLPGKIGGGHAQFRRSTRRVGKAPKVEMKLRSSPK